MPSATATLVTGFKTIGAAWGSSFAASAAYATTYTATAMAINAGISYGLQELMGEERGGGVGESLSSRLSMRKEPTQPHRVIYGRTKVGADLTYYTVNNDGKTLHMICTFAGHECEEIESIELDDTFLDLDGSGNAQGKYSKGNVKINKHPGDQTTADSEAVNNIKVWSDNHIGHDKCYIYLQADATNREDFRDIFPNGMPEVRAIIKGKNDIYDPRDNTTKYTNNPALICRDFLTDGKYGYNFSSGQVDTDDVKNSANICEEQVNGQDRYTCNGTFRDDARNDMIFNNLLSSMAGKTTWSGGEQRLLAGAWRTPVATFDRSNIIDSIKQQPKKSRKNLYNVIRGTFANPDQGFQPASFPEIKQQKFVDEDGGVEIPKTIELNFTTNEEEAQRIARLMYRQHRRQGSLNTRLDFSAFNVQAGDNAKLDIPHYDRGGDWSPKTFQVSNWSMSFQEGEEGSISPAIDVGLSETDIDAFNDDSLNTVSLSSPVISV